MNFVSKLTYYPLKSGAGVSSSSCSGNANGIIGDRLYCLFDAEQKKFISLRETSLLPDISIIDNDNEITISIDNSIRKLNKPPSTKDIIKVWSRHVEVETYPGKISEYISAYLKMNVILAKIKHFDDYTQCFMDTGPIHIISQKSLNLLSLNCGLAEIDSSIFRPNIVVSDFGIRNEKDIKKILINRQVFNVTEITERCNAIPVLHRKLQSVSDSPVLEILDEWNDFDGAVFGIYVRAESDFRININDHVEIEST
ncbi:MOSC domain-containing protein [Serratia microhaemolytica]|uniref:MOSC domain-containing protein n=1 Tax=Serratia microhaemolytica TaxID=2675110 RepID=UPI000FDF4FF5|nr:MOSC N-terminal beta barrel domain-containing protein [Serratia microhaemolytica]